MGNKPRIRFKGFNDDWEQCKLGDIATFSKGNGYSKSDLAPSGEPIILYGRLYTNYETTIRNVDTFVELKDKSVISQGGEVIVPASGETAEDISRASVVKNQGIIIGGDLNVIKVNHLLNPTFLALTISNGEQQKELSKRAQGKSVVHLHNSDLQEVNLTFPLLNEQKEISSLFEKMDSVITLHQCKLEKLKLTKKALLQKLFPKNGKHIPEIRFKGFTDAWEQRKLGECMDSFEYGLNAAAKEYDGMHKYIRITDIDDETHNFIQSNLTSPDIDFNSDFSDYKLNINDIVFARTGASVGKTYLYNPSDGDLYYAGFLIRGKVNEACDAGFIYQNTLTRDYDSFIRITSQRSGQPGVNSKEYATFRLNIPCKCEQEKISKLLNRLDKLFTLHQRKLERLQEVKKGLLQKMFV